MPSYAMVGTNDLPKAISYFDDVLSLIGAGSFYSNDRVKLWGTASGPFFAVASPFNGEPATVGNGSMVTFVVDTRAAVRDVHAKALSLGGSDEGPVGVRGDDPDGFYAGYFRDLDGNKFCVCKWGPDPAG